MPASRTSRHTTLYDLDLPVASDYYKLDESGLDIRVVLEPFNENPDTDWWFSLSDWGVAWSRKRPRKVSKEDFLAEQNDFWGSIRTVGGSLCPSFFDVEFRFSLSARSVVPRVGA